MSKIVRKILTVLMIGVSAIGMVGCGDNTQEQKEGVVLEQQKEKENIEKSIEKPEPPKVNYMKQTKENLTNNILPKFSEVTIQYAKVLDNALDKQVSWNEFIKESKTKEKIINNECMIEEEVIKNTPDKKAQDLMKQNNKMVKKMLKAMTTMRKASEEGDVIKLLKGATMIDDVEVEVKKLKKMLGEK